MKKLSISLIFAFVVAFAPATALALDAPVISMETYWSTNDTTPTFSWDAPSGATWYEYALDNGSYVGIGNVLTYTLGTQGEGWHTFYLRAYDYYGNVSTTASKTFEIDTTGPTVTLYADTYIQSGSSVIFTAYADGNEVYIFSCTLVINSVDYSMTSEYEPSNTRIFTLTRTFSTTGTYAVYARCRDGDTNYGYSATSTITVNTPIEASSGQLIKTACASGAEVNDPCKAVYYYGHDGRRHVFPLESIYYSWYSNFDSVVTVSSSFMSSLTLGENVTFKPGTALVQLSYGDNVYALEEGGILRHYLSESLIVGDYGSGWTSYLQELPDAFYGNYSIGSDIDQSTDYDPASAEANVTSIDDNF